MKGRGSIAWFLVPIVFVGGGVAMGEQTLYISKTASYENPKKVREKVREECAPETQFTMMMREEILKRTSIQEVVLTDEPTTVKNGLAVTFSILSLNIPPSAGWTTEKRSMKVKSVLYRKGIIADEYVRYADAQGGGRLFNRSACQIVEGLERDIAGHSAEWIKVKILQATPPTTPSSHEVRP